MSANVPGVIRTSDAIQTSDVCSCFYVMLLLANKLELLDIALNYLMTPIRSEVSLSKAHGEFYLTL